MFADELAPENVQTAVLVTSCHQNLGKREASPGQATGKIFLTTPGGTLHFSPLGGWGRSSVGRAPQWHCGGQGFESPRLHHPFSAVNIDDRQILTAYSL